MKKGGRMEDLCHDREWQGKETVDFEEAENPA